MDGNCENDYFKTVREQQMPVIARFYGIIIKMYFLAGEHNPPHFHAIYGEYVGVIDLNRLDMIEGDLPRKALFLVQEWAGEHREALQKMWDTQEFIQLPPLV